VTGLRQVSALLAIACSLAAHAHEDTPLQRLPSGVIVGIPSPLGAYRLNIEGLGTSAPKIEFQLGDRVTTLLPCAAGAIKSRSSDDVQVAGSWYGQFSPNYVHVTFMDSWRPPYLIRPASYDFLFNMHTGELMDVTRIIWGANDYRRVQNPLPKTCKAASVEVRPNISLQRDRDR
jgi:hypothetical protein